MNNLTAPAVYTRTGEQPETYPHLPAVGEVTTHANSSYAPWRHVCSTMQATMWATLLDLAEPIVKHFRSDMFHDAHFIRDTWSPENPTLLWNVDEWGTHICDSADLESYRRFGFVVTLVCDDPIALEDHGYENRKWSYTVERVS
jgi:hypothetical protein